MNQNSEDFFVVNRPPAIIFRLFEATQCAEGDTVPDTSRPGIWERASRYIVGLGDAASDVLSQAAKEKPELGEVPAAVPGFLKIRVDPTLQANLVEVFSEAFGGLKRVKAFFLAKIVLTAYLTSFTVSPQPTSQKAPENQLNLLELNRRFAKLLTEPSADAQEKLNRIAKILEE